MKKKYILALTFLCLLMGQNSYGQMNGGDLDEICIGPGCDEEEDSNDPCDIWSSSYDYYICNGMGDDEEEDSEDPCDPYSNAYNPMQCGGDTGDPCDPYSSAYDYLGCNFWSEDPPIDEDNPCSFAAQQAAIGATNFFANHALELSDNFSPFSTISGQNEEAFIITEVNGVIRPGSIKNGVFVAGGIDTVSPTGGTITITSHTIADVHTHTAGGLSRPSVEDLWSIGDSKKFSPNFSDSYVIAADGTKYDLHISDVSKLADFMQTNGNFYDPVTKGFKDGTPLSMDYNYMVNSFTSNNNMSLDEARERAYALVLKGAGIDLLKAEAGSNDFKKFDVKPAKNPDGTDKKDANGFTIYESVDCL